MGNLIKIEDIEKRIYFIRGVKVMLDRDLAELYEVETKRLKEQVRRNIDRFPADFMFELTKDEFINWRSQIATSKSDKMGLRYPPMAFTEQGVAMLSSVLRSKRAIQVNVQIMRAFVKLRHIILDHDDLKRELDELRKQTDDRFQIVFTVLDKLVSEEQESETKIGFIKNALDDSSI
jgi:phage regulator Rha-like protein